MKTLIIYLATTLLIFFSILIIAQNVNVLSPLFPLRRLDEKIILMTKHDPDSHTKYLLDLVDNRMSDLSFIMNKNQYAYLLPASLRYSSTVGTLTEYVQTHNLKQFTPDIQKKLSRHTQILQRLIKQYHGKHEEWKYLQDDINYIEQYKTQLPK